MKIINFKNMLNMRDCTGYQTKDGHTIKDHMLIRSDAPKEMSDEELNYLKDNNITTEIDLRTSSVIFSHPSSLKALPWIHYHHFEIVEGSQSSLHLASIPELYMKMLSNKETFKEILTTIINAPGGVIVNCTAGKDRTGIVIFLILDTLGVLKEDIIEDYIISAPLIDSKIDEYRKTHPHFPSTLGVSKREDIESFLNEFYKKYDNASEYLLEIGISEEQIKTLKEKLLK